MNSVTAGAAAALTSTTAAASTIGGRLCKIVLTGGPGGGKSTALTKLRNRLVHRGLQVTLIGENATPLIDKMGGYEPSWRHTWKHIEFQRIMLKAQIEQEDNITSLCRLREDDRVIILDRGAFDGRTFCTDEEWEKVRNSNNIYTDKELFDRYDVVIHMTSAAVDRPQFYSYGAGSTNESRFHTPSQAAEADKLGRDFVTHTGQNVFVVDTKENFDDKVEEVFRCVQGAISRLWGPTVVEGLSTKRVQHKVRVLRSWEEICQLPEVTCGSKEAAKAAYISEITYLNKDQTRWVRRWRKVGNISGLDKKTPAELVKKFPSLEEERLLPQGDSSEDRSKMESSEETVMIDSGERGPKRMANLSEDAYERAIREYEAEKARHGGEDFPKQILKRQVSYETRYITLKAYSGLDGSPCPGYENIWVLDMEDPAVHSTQDTLSLLPSFVEPVPEAVINSPSPSQHTLYATTTIIKDPPHHRTRRRETDTSPIAPLALQSAGISTAARSKSGPSVTRKRRLPKSKLVLCHHPTADAAAGVSEPSKNHPAGHPSKRSREQASEAVTGSEEVDGLRSKMPKSSTVEDEKENSSSSNVSSVT
ncbi:hypothetical protein Pmar_PMAR002378 [Perkinsus marinus ATCC 50983]|uniref:NadR/Ttd14 AAA domain-containing protein n=1 Tax=Perkinsus marinus (strain ATCC 50983 / TXsc) TaxID=423536 RepID=C5LYS5_PERM5|nr:hypothetical protein Pmar_PMAR002378 [Perkinsus marinus ATCC 50983]EEQ98099.1 hypothetical protein Pmar_PMAR002378 [Perkinsus marinus ATCC 50983]|eukprot:XP_002765382.1 hypothetical protein Pmar_PMAR002378 [Perkinsus marinus ATCC 50983]